MPRPKGSKNKKKTIVVTSTISSSDSTMENMNSQKVAILSEIAEAEKQMESLKALVKEKKNEIKKIEKSMLVLAAKKEAEEKAKAEAAKKAQLSNLLSELLESGLSTDEILSKIKA